MTTIKTKVLLDNDTLTAIENLQDDKNWFKSFYNSLLKLNSKVLPQMADTDRFDMLNVSLEKNEWTKILKDFNIALDLVNAIDPEK